MECHRRTTANITLMQVPDYIVKYLKCKIYMFFYNIILKSKTESSYDIYDAIILLNYVFNSYYSFLQVSD